MTLTEFLLARIAEDEATARAALDPDRPGAHWQWVNSDTDAVVDSPSWEDNPSLRTVEEFPTPSGVGDLPAFVINHAEADEPRALPHIARHDPARVLAECEAKRQMVEWYEAVASADDRKAPEGITAHMAALGFLALLSLPYADHPDYRDEWKP